MEHRATYKTAILAGAWSSLGLCTAEAALGDYEVSAFVHNMVFLVLAVIFFFVPVLIYVVGREHLKFSFHYSFSKEYFSALPSIWLRMFTWFLSAGIVAVLYSLALNGLFGMKI